MGHNKAYFYCHRVTTQLQLINIYHILAVTNGYEDRSAGTRFLSIFLSVWHRIPEGLYLNIGRCHCEI